MNDPQLYLHSHLWVPFLSSATRGVRAPSTPAFKGREQNSKIKPEIEASMLNNPSHLAPGMFVVHPTRSDWGLGQVQSVIGNRITVNFENAGKQLINGDTIALEVVDASGGRGD
jgi:FKBP-type peptidyl-prolyl cis-trans isomerase 2